MLVVNLDLNKMKTMNVNLLEFGIVFIIRLILQKLIFPFGQLHGIQHHVLLPEAVIGF